MEREAGGLAVRYTPSPPPHGAPVEPLLFLMTSVVLGLSAGLAPGPLTTLVFRQTLRYGSREGVKVALAPLLTDGVLVLLAAFAIGRLSDLDGVFALISLVGALFLIWLSWDTWKISELRVDLGEENPGTILKSVGDLPVRFGGRRSE